MKFLKIILLIVVILGIVFLFSLRLLIPPMLEKQIIKFDEEHPELTLKVDDIHISWTGDVVLEQILFQPADDSVAFTRKIPFEQDWMKISVERLAVDLPHIWTYWQDDKWLIDWVKADHLTVNVYRDKRKRDAPFKKKMLLASLLKSLPLDFRIKILDVKDGSFRYTEQRPYYLGSVWFDRVQLHMRNITNDSVWIKKHPKLKVDANGLIGGKVAMECNYVFHLDDPEDRFEARGKIGSFDANVLDKTLLNLTGVHLVEGKFEWITFQMYGNDEQAVCTLESEYKNLELEIRNKKSKQKSFWKSLGANLIIRNDNLKADPAYQTGHSTYIRRQDRFLFNYQWSLIKLALLDILLIGNF